MGGVKFSHRPALEFRVGDVEAPLLYGHIRLSNFKAFFENPQENVIRGDFANQTHEHVIIGRDRREQGHVRCLNTATKSSPQVHFPGRFETQLPIVKTRSEARECSLVRRLSADVVSGIAAEGILLLWEQLADGNAPPRLGFKDTSSGSLERRILPVRCLNKSREHGIVESNPPGPFLRWFAFHSRTVRVASLRSEWGGWRLVVRANHGAGGEGEDTHTQQKKTGCVHVYLKVQGPKSQAQGQEVPSSRFQVNEGPKSTPWGLGLET